MKQCYQALRLGGSAISIRLEQQTAKALSPVFLADLISSWEKTKIHIEYSFSSNRIYNNDYLFFYVFKYRIIILHSLFEFFFLSFLISKTLKLSFKFPYYGHYLDSVVLTTGGKLAFVGRQTCIFFFLKKSANKK